MGTAAPSRRPRAVDPTLSRADLTGLAARLELPHGWAYQPRMLTEALRVDTTNRPTHVTQDDLTNSYSLELDCPSATDET